MERFFLGGGDRPHNFGNLPTFCVGFLHKKLEVFHNWEYGYPIEIPAGHAPGTIGRADCGSRLRGAGPFA